MALTLRQISSELPSLLFFLIDLKPYFLKIGTSFDVYFHVPGAKNKQNIRKRMTKKDSSNK